MLAQNFKTAADLGISDEELDAHVRVLGMLERGELSHLKNQEQRRKGSPRPVGSCFNMATTAIELSCGTVACIGGWVALIMGMNDRQASAYVFDDCNRSDGLEHLYYPPVLSSFDNITTDQAARALRNWLTTGEPIWDEVLA